jgi:hypothetical protein
VIYAGLPDPIPAQAPPAFFAAAADDPLSNAMPELFIRWRASGAPAEIHIMVHQISTRRFKAGACIAIALLAGSALAAETNSTSPAMAAQQRCAALKEQTGAALGEPSARIL